MAAIAKPTRPQTWAEVQVAILDARASGAAVRLWTADGWHGPGVVVDSDRGMVVLRSHDRRGNRKVTTLRLDQVVAVDHVAPVAPIVRPVTP
jgi:hypothetical protein